MTCHFIFKENDNHYLVVSSSSSSFWAVKYTQNDNDRTARGPGPGPHIYSCSNTTWMIDLILSNYKFGFLLQESSK